jgi:hypothetical protein
MASANHLPNPKIFHFNCTVKIRASRTPGKSGSLCQFTQLKAAKDGSMSEYPPIEGERDPANIDHWYWHYQILKSCMTVYIIALSLSMYSTMSFAFNPQH